ncbi:RNA-binding protein [Sandaracinomonas limnophila]|uniref:RNA-binding protein n=1 Tax=Sandaracinomonas limnophila TaxID=1862386 RepID=A0A437PRV0_9BACT|nr:VCBS repeat-containing protein [Sandaracinomonas limnophila]RVU24994.1 RNA-binding protein [Sandaracinomonas limnophila]
MKKYTWFFAILAMFYLSSCGDKKTFELLDASHTGISFSNDVKDNDTLNILTQEYLYNGGGVGMGDFNQDGLQDLFFAGNIVESKLYINKGELKFEDVTPKAGLDTKKRWCSGVSVVDINADGLLDIYVSVTMKTADTDRENLLFVNQGITNGVPTFKEMAKEYGVNDNGFSQHAVFFDYDKDGDLDLYVLTDKIDDSPAIYRPKVTDGSYPNTDRLYKNEYSETLKHPVFKNVSKEAGITIEGFGLGIAICDINRDNWPDIYVTNDYVSDDLLYINNQDGTFTDQAKKYFKHTSQAAMGNEVNDINNDGLADFVILDMLPKNNERKKQFLPANNYQNYVNSNNMNYTYQFMRNTMQLNPGVYDKDHVKQFSEVGLLAGMAETEWSWCPSVTDFDNDGYRDLLITNGFPKDVTDRDFMMYHAESGLLATQDMLLDQIPVIKVVNYAFKNKGNLKFEDVSKEWGFDIPSFSNGAAYGDLDNDGDLDYVVNNINDQAFVYKNNSIENSPNESHYLRLKVKSAKGTPAEAALMCKIEGKYDNGEYFYYEYSPYRGYLSSVDPICHIGLGKSRKIKELRILWPNDKMQVITNPGIDKVVEIKQADASLAYESILHPEKPYFADASSVILDHAQHQEFDFVDFNFQNLMPHKLSELGPCLTQGDVNGDGRIDFFMGGAKFTSGAFYIQQADGTYKARPLEKEFTMMKKMGEDLGVLLVDFDKDNDLDLYICRGGNENKANDPALQDVIYQNDGKGNFILIPTALPNFFESNSVVKSIDFDHDGDLDLFVGGRNIPFQYPKATNSRLFENVSKSGQIQFKDVTSSKAPELLNLGLICDAVVADVDGDKWEDLIIAGEYTPVQVYKNSKGKFAQQKETGIEKILGLWTSVQAADLDKDGDVDFVAGNMGENTLLQASSDHPVDVVHGDLDGNGIYDVFPFVHFVNEKGAFDSYPLHGKDDVNKMLITTKKRWVYFKEYGKSTQETFFTEEEKKKSTKSSFNLNSSVWIENVGGGKFKIHELPVEAQFSCINAIQIADVNKDKNLDIIFVGNNYGNEVFIGRYDASNGGVLLGNGKGGFKFYRDSGFEVPADAKSLIRIQNQFIAGQNRGPLKVFKLL